MIHLWVQGFLLLRVQVLLRLKEIFTWLTTTILVRKQTARAILLPITLIDWLILLHWGLVLSLGHLLVLVRGEFDHDLLPLGGLRLLWNTKLLHDPRHFDRTFILFLPLVEACSCQVGQANLLYWHLLREDVLLVCVEK